MAYQSLKDCILDLEKHGHLVRIREEVDPYLEMAEIHRRVFARGGPALFYEKIKGCSFPAVSNLFGTMDRARFIFRGTLEHVKSLVRLKADPVAALHGTRLQDLLHARFCLPRKVSRPPVLEYTTRIDQLPQIQSWPGDGGPYVLLPQVYTEDPECPGIAHSNLGMYRIQLSGNEYEQNKEIGLHYQIRRDIGIHHHKAFLKEEPLRVSVFVGGPPAHAFAALMALPERMSEIHFAGLLAGRRFRYQRENEFLISADADFCITGWVASVRKKNEGPFGDHLGYYSLRHPFPFIKIEKVYHRKDAIWPFTIVGRPPQEDSVLGKLVQEIAGPMIPKEMPGVRSLHAVDEAGIHPLLLAVASERYHAELPKRPEELLKTANSILGYGPCSLAKYLMIVAGEDAPNLRAENVPGFFKHLLERIDWKRDLHFQTCTTIDTLDYSGPGLNEGSKVVMAAAGKKKRELSKHVPEEFKFPEGFSEPRMVMPGVLAVRALRFQDGKMEAARMEMLGKYLQPFESAFQGIPWIVVCDSPDFVSANLSNFLWVTFTKSNPSHDIYGVGSEIRHKHWGCSGPLIIDARSKPHHAPELTVPDQVRNQVDRLALPGSSLFRIL